MRQIEVLVAVEPEPLMKLIEHLLQRPEFRVVKKLHEWPALPKQAVRLHPHLIITNARLLGNQAASIIADLKFSSPSSKIIVVSFPHDLSRQARRWGADAYLREEHLVRRLVLTARKLVKLRRPAASSSAGAASRDSSSAKKNAGHFC
ncbi:MAG: response regulator transcription factor [Acidobacteria bacterium]|nr:response regulator transcription factor [Acidobacteriota bacterium]